MSGQDVTDPKDLVIPSLALALMAADIAADRPGEERVASLSSRDAALAFLSGSAGGEMAPRTAQGICTGAQRFIDDVIGPSSAPFTRPRRARGPGGWS